MLEESFLKTNFIGRDGFRWWIGQTAPASAQGNQANGGGWGNRFKVRIFGYHPYSEVHLPNEDLPWAIAILGCTDGSGASNRATSVKIAPGDTVFGFFLDGDNAQQPAILGVFGRTDQVPSTTYKNPFEPFTGFTGRIKPAAGGVVVPNESNENTTTAQKAPRSVDKTTADKLNNQQESTGGSLDQVLSAEDAALKEAAKKEVSASSSIGKKVTGASKEPDSAVQKIKNEVDNFSKRVKEITGGIQGAVNGANEFVGEKKQQLFDLIDGATQGIQNGAARMVNDMTQNLSNALSPVLNTGLQALYDSVYALVFAATQNKKLADIAGTIAQATFIGPVKDISDAMPCIANKIIAGIGDTIKGVLQSVADNVTNFVSCIGDQVVGALMNHIIGGVSSFMAPLMSAVSKISMGFSPLGFLNGTASAILGLAQDIGCNDFASDFDLASNEWVIGKGFSDKAGVPVDEILSQANEAMEVGNELLSTGVNALQDIAGATGSLGVFDFMNPSVSQPGFESSLSKCYAGPPELGGCGGTKVKIFGGKGSGTTAEAIIGGIKDIVNGGRGITGSVIGVDLVNGGGGYTFPPFVEIVDECDRGFGATARSVIDYDPDSPTYQQVTDIYIVTEGQGYTQGTDDVDYILDDEKGPEIIRPGIGYDPNDTVTDTAGNEYTIEIDAVGSITKIIRITNNEYASVDDLLEYTINSTSGTGAKLAPRLRRRPIDPQGTVRQVIDCISKDDDLVGYVNGQPYYGPFHIHMGRKMTGISHTGTGQYIYDSPEESLGSSRQSFSTTTQTTGGGGASTTTSSTTPTSSTTTGGGGTQTSPTPTPTPPPSSPPPSPPPSGGGSGGGY